MTRERVFEMDLFSRLAPLDEDDADDYEELQYEKVKYCTEAACLLRKPWVSSSNKTDDDVWFPLSQLRTLDGALYASKWILKRQEID
jgi:hypothetical protein